MDNARFEEFSKCYRVCLAEAVSYEPHKYAYPVEKADEVATKILNAIKTNPRSVTYTNSPAFKFTCTRLGIKYTVKGIIAYLNGE